MPPRLNLFAARSALPAFRQPSTAAVLRTPAPCTRFQQRWNSSNSDGKDKKDLEEAQRQAESMPHVSEEAAEISKIMNKDKEKWCDGTPSSPELEQGTPVSEILSRDKEGQKYAPKVFQDQMKNANNNGNKRSFSTSTRRYQIENQSQNPGQNQSGPEAGLPGAGSRSGSGTDANSLSDAEQAALLETMISQVTQETEALLPEGLKFPAPESIPRTENMRKRYEGVVEQFTKNLMWDGKLAIAQKNMSYILDHLRSSPPPVINPRRPLLPGPPAPQLPLNPVLYLALIVDSVAPLIKLHHATGIAGGGQSVQIPNALSERQRRRAAIGWIIAASEKRKDSRFAVRVANELVAVAEGRSGVWEKREAVHKMGIAARVNIGAKAKGKGKYF
ncbi:ribosomal protein S7 domain-containing protein [Aspergillus oleicola]